MPLDPAVDKVLKDNGLGNDAVWQHKQSQSWIMKHWACEHAAIKAGIQFDAPVVIDADASNKVAVICVTGRLGDQVQWSFGEAAPYNTQQTYPFAMAEKRAKDRVILKLLGVHGKVYSEEEADDFKPPEKEHGEARGPLGLVELKEKLKKFADDLPACTEPEMLAAVLEGYKPALEQGRRDLPGWFRTKNGSDVKGFDDRIAEQEAICERNAMNPINAG